MLDFTSPKIPNVVIDFIEQNMVQNPGGGKIIYIMKDGRQRIYCAYLYHDENKQQKTYINRPAFFALKGKKVRKIENIDEYFQLLEKQEKYYVKRSKNCYKILNKNLEKNSYQTFVSEENVIPPKIPKSVVEYCDKYILKHKSRRIDYLFFWQGKHFYRVCYQIRPRCKPHKKIILSYDGKTAKLLNDEEISNLVYNYSDYYYYMLFTN